MSTAKLVLRVEHEGAALKLTSPAVGFFTCAVPEERAVTAGQTVGVLIALGRSFALVVPDGVSGVVRNTKPERVHAPVGFGTPLYELAPLASAAHGGKGAAKQGASSDGALIFRSPSAGRFWHRSTPAEAPLVSAGEVIEAGHAIGLIEVMKTFTHLAYTADGGLPENARIVRVLAGDGDEVNEDDPLIEVEAG